MTDFLHILYRELLHFAWGVTGAMMFYFLIRFLQRRVRIITLWITTEDRVAMVLAPLCTWILTPWREAYDVQAGGSPFKSTLDGIVWLITPFLAMYGTYRVKYKD